MYYAEKDFERDIDILVDKIQKSGNQYLGIYGIPRGGSIIAVALGRELNLPLVSKEMVTSRKILVVDDLVDSGKTRMRWRDFDFACLHVKERAKLTPVNYFNHISYFWEENESPAEDSVIRLLQMVGEDVTRDGLKETSKRFVNSWKYLFSGYNADVKNIIKCFDGDGYNQIVLLKDIELYSMCEHHILPFIGRAHIAYIPNKKVIGISKLARLLEVFSRRLQIQERICEQVTETLMTYLQPQGAACIIQAEHLCMRMRGVQKQNSVMVTSSLKGVFLDNLATREELMGLIKG
jgi:GTP cyclohydrolase I